MGFRGVVCALGFALDHPRGGGKVGTVGVVFVSELLEMTDSDTSASSGRGSTVGFSRRGLIGVSVDGVSGLLNLDACPVLLAAFDVLNERLIGLEMGVSRPLSTLLACAIDGVETLRPETA